MPGLYPNTCRVKSEADGSLENLSHESGSENISVGFTNPPRIEGKGMYRTHDKKRKRK